MQEPSENTVPSVPGALKPLSTGTKIRLMTVIVLITLPAVWLIIQSFTSNVTGTPRILFLTLALLLLFLPARVVQLSIRRRMKTGHWSLWPSDAERAAHAARRGPQTPEQARRMSILWWLVDGSMLVLCITSLWKYLRPNHAPLDGIDRVFVGLWMLLLAQYLFTIYRKRKQKPTASG